MCGVDCRTCATAISQILRSMYVCMYVCMYPGNTTIGILRFRSRNVEPVLGFVFIHGNAGAVVMLLGALSLVEKLEARIVSDRPPAS